MKTKSVILHVSLWIFFTLFVFDYHWFELSWLEALSYAIVEVISYAVIFYLNLYIIRSLIDKGVWTAICGSLFMVILYIMLMKVASAESHFYEGTPVRNLLSMLLNCTLFIGLSYALHFVESYFKNERALLQIQAQNKAMQLDQLKAKINPHFIFNTLNNLSGLIQTGNTNGVALANKLSEVLRYSIDQNVNDSVPITKEMDYIRSYAELVLLQEPASTWIDIYTEGLDGDLRIMPFVLISFFENAVKYSDIRTNEEGYLKVEAIFEEDFSFTIKNTKHNQIIGSSGIGNDNIRNQLDLVYGDNYSLEIHDDEVQYTLELIIKASQFDRS